ncbi:MAG: cation:proton antiporter subunit C [Candidatus Latescibacterota bacterium]|nr:cation:proton antiporter subunit C [Candidatus Latescibacterota bacterium]
MDVGLINYWVVIFLMMTGFYIVMASRNLIKKMVGLSLFQSSVFIMYITAGKVLGGTAPILTKPGTDYSNPLPHVLILTAIVVGIATTGMGMALIIRINEAYGTVEENEIRSQDAAE